MRDRNIFRPQVCAIACKHIKNTKIYYIKLLKCTKPLAHYLAKLLHPKYKGAKFHYQQKDKAKQWTADCHLELLPFVANFNAFETQNVTDVMIHLLSCPTSSASVEQVFSSSKAEKSVWHGPHGQ